VNVAAALSGSKILVSADEVELSDDEYLWQDLIGCEVYAQHGDQLLGTVAALEEYGAQDILSVHTIAGAERPGEWLLPFIAEVVVDVDMDARRISVALPEGMDACFTPRF